MIRYLTFDQLLLVHSMLVDETGGSHGIRERGVLRSAVQSPRQVVFGEELYPTLYLEAGMYAHSIVMNHPFVDGNKRTGTSTAIIFLEDNGHRFIGKKGTIEKFAVEIVVKKLTVEDIANWLEKHTKKAN